MTTALTEAGPSVSVTSTASGVAQVRAVVAEASQVVARVTPTETVTVTTSGVQSVAGAQLALQGNPGDKGDQGDPGPKGDQGDPGDPGPKGDQGDPGDPGPKGDQGDPGPKGDQGDPGPKGDKGDQGDPGTPGTNGTDGSVGADGADGAPGPTAALQWQIAVNATADTDPGQGMIATPQSSLDSSQIYLHKASLFAGSAPFDDEFSYDFVNQLKVGSKIGIYNPGSTGYRFRTITDLEDFGDWIELSWGDPAVDSGTINLSDGQQIHINFMAAQDGGGGHVIEDKDGTPLPQRDTLRVKGDGATVQDTPTGTELIVDKVNVDEIRMNPIRYSTNLAQVFNTNVYTPINYETEEYDSDGVISATAPWTFTAPRDMYVHIEASLLLDFSGAWNAGEVWQMGFGIDGVYDVISNRSQMHDNQRISVHVFGSADIFLLAGQELRPAVFHHANANLPAYTSGSDGRRYNYVSLHEITPGRIALPIDAAIGLVGLTAADTSTPSVGDAIPFDLADPQNDGVSISGSAVTIASNARGVLSAQLRLGFVGNNDFATLRWYDLTAGEFVGEDVTVVSLASAFKQSPACLATCLVDTSDGARSYEVRYTAISGVVNAAFMDGNHAWFVTSGSILPAASSGNQIANNLGGKMSINDPEGSGQPIPTGLSGAHIEFDVIDYGPENVQLGSDSRYTVGAGEAGRYLVTAFLRMEQTGTQTGDAMFLTVFVYDSSDTIKAAIDGHNAGYASQSHWSGGTMSDIIELDEGDYLKLYARQESGSTDYLADARLAVERLGGSVFPAESSSSTPAVTTGNKTVFASAVNMSGVHISTLNAPAWAWYSTPYADPDGATVGASAGTNPDLPGSPVSPDGERITLNSGPGVYRVVIDAIVSSYIPADVGNVNQGLLVNVLIYDGTQKKASYRNEELRGRRVVTDGVVTIVQGFEFRYEGFIEVLEGNELGLEIEAERESVSVNPAEDYLINGSIEIVKVSE